MSQHILTMRPAIEADIPGILRMLADDELGKAREVVSDPVDPAYLAAFRAIAEDANQHLVVAEVDGRVVGTLQLSYLPGMSHRGSWRAQIEAVRVDSATRGIGLGKRMILWAVDEAKARGCRMVQLTSNASRRDAHRFYEGLGFEASHVGFKKVL
ncbi:GNAT family N-acetyltransferase [Primorskyibacter sp. 2E233]|uniref:GNAT family N-acetyltransferase n=1 Tax=Primorskyibacter sp. 2E233 TaxID=3413431 RepID=UPI003BF43B4C